MIWDIISLLPFLQTTGIKIYIFFCTELLFSSFETQFSFVEGYVLLLHLSLKLSLCQFQFRFSFSARSQHSAQRSMCFPPAYSLIYK